MSANGLTVCISGTWIRVKPLSVPESPPPAHYGTVVVAGLRYRTPKYSLHIIFACTEVVLYYCESVLWPRARARCVSVCLCVRGGRAAGARCACCTPASIERASKRATLVIRGRTHAAKSISTNHLCWRRLSPCRKDTGTFRSATASLGVSASHQSNTKPYRYDGFSAQNGDT